MNSVSRPVQWLIFAGVTLFLGGFLVLGQVLTSGIRNQNTEDWLAPRGFKDAKVVLHQTNSDAIVKEIVLYKGGSAAVRVQVDGWSGQRRAWVLFDPMNTCRGLSLPDNGRFSMVSTPQGLDAVSGASVDVRLIRNAIARATKILIATKRGSGV